MVFHQLDLTSHNLSQLFTGFLARRFIDVVNNPQVDGAVHVEFWLSRQVKLLQQLLIFSSW